MERVAKWQDAGTLSPSRLGLESLPVLHFELLSLVTMEAIPMRRIACPLFLYCYAGAGIQRQVRP